jgi:hypothetical protein
VTNVAHLEARRHQAEPLSDAGVSEAMFRFLGTGVRVVSANVGLLRHWAAMYGAFRVPPGPATVTVYVHDQSDGPPVPGRVTIETGGVRQIWSGEGPVFPQLATAPLDRWVYLRGAAVGRAGQAVLVLAGPETGKTVLALSVVARGAMLLADDLLPLDPFDLLLAPFPKALRFRRDALSLLSIDLADPALTPFRTRSGALEWRADPHALLGSRTGRAAAEVGAIVLLDGVAQTAEPRLDHVRPDQALLGLFGHLFQAPSRPGDTEQALRRLCRQVPTYRLTAGPPAATARLVDELLV